MAGPRDFDRNNIRNGSKDPSIKRRTPERGHQPQTAPKRGHSGRPSNSQPQRPSPRPNPRNVRGRGASRKNNNIKQSLLTVFFSAVIGFLFAVSDFFSRIVSFISNLDKKAKRALIAGAVFFVVFVFFVVIIISFTKANGLEIYLGGEIAGIVKLDNKKEQDTESIMALVKQKLEQDAGEKVQYYETVTIVKNRVSNFQTLETVIDNIAAKINYRVEAAVIYVNGGQKAIMKNKEEADGLLNEIKNMYNQDGLGIIEAETGFLEEVSVVMEYVDQSFRLDYDQAKSILTDTEPVDDYHVIRSGENLTTIRNIYGMSELAILDKNPGLDKDNLKPDQMLAVVKHKPLLSVKTVADVITPTVTKYTTEYIDVSSQPKTHTKVIVQGKDGQEEVTERITRINGLETSREVLNRVTTTAPVNEVIERGTRN